MHLARAAAILFLLPTATYGDDAVQTVPLVSTPFYNERLVEKEILERVEAHVYDGYEAELCIRDIDRCSSSIFEPYKTTINDKTVYLLAINSRDWPSLADDVKREVVDEIKYFT